MRRIDPIAALLLLGMLALPVAAKIMALIPLRAVLAEANYILTVKIQALDPDRPAMILTADEALKGKPTFTRMPVSLKGDAEAAKEKQTPDLLKRLAVGLPLVLFVNQRDDDYTAFVYTNGTWFQMTGTTDGGAVRWSFTHLEPYLRRTFKGTTAELKQLIVDGLAGKKKLPDVDPKEKPGLGPEVEPTKKTGMLKTAVPFAVIPTVFIGGPLALLAALFPALFGGVLFGFKRWLAALTVVSLNSTLLFAQEWGRGWLADSWWGTPTALWLTMSAITALGLLWAWRRHLARLSESGNSPEPPTRGGVATLLAISLLTSMAAWYWLPHDLHLLDIWGKTVLTLVVGIWLATMHALWLRMAAAQPARPALPGEGVLLWGTLAACTGLAFTFAPTPVLGGGGGESVQQGEDARSVLFEQTVGPPINLREPSKGLQPGRLEPVAHTDPVLKAVQLLIESDRFELVIRPISRREPNVGRKWGRLEPVTYTDFLFKLVRLLIEPDPFERSVPQLIPREHTVGDQPARFQRVAWRFTPREPSWIAASPRVAGDAVYIGAVHGAAFRSGAVYCLDRLTGQQRWSFTKMKDSFSSPTVADGRLYIGEGFHQHKNCKVHCLNVADGKKLWDFPTGSHTESTPTVVDGKVYFGAGDDGMYCLDAVSGKEIWHLHQLHVDANPLVVDGKVYCGSGAGDVYKETAAFCLDAATGKVVWKTPTELPVWGEPALVEGKLLVGVGNGNFQESAEQPAGALLCLDAATGRRLWQSDARDGVHVKISADRESAYFASRDRHVYAVALDDGAVRWKTDLGSPIVASPALTPDGRHLVAIASEGQVACLDLRSGKINWSFDVRKDADQPTTLFSSPTIMADADGKRRIYFGSGLSGFSRGILYCLEDSLGP